MRDFALQAAGALAIVVAVLHGAIAEWRVFPAARIEPPWTRRLLRMVWQASTVSWIAVGALLTAAPSFGSEPARHAIIATAVAVHGYGAIGNAIVTRGRHPGAWLMGGAIVLALLGI